MESHETRHPGPGVRALRTGCAVLFGLTCTAAVLVPQILRMQKSGGG